MEILKWIAVFGILVNYFWILWYCYCMEKRCIDASVEKEHRQTQLYERLLEKLEDIEDGEINT